MLKYASGAKFASLEQLPNVSSLLNPIGHTRFLASTATDCVRLHQYDGLLNAVETAVVDMFISSPSHALSLAPSLHVVPVSVHAGNAATHVADRPFLLRRPPFSQHEQDPHVCVSTDNE